MIIQNLMNRLGDYIKNNKVSEDIDLFKIFTEALDHI